MSAVEHAGIEITYLLLECLALVTFFGSRKRKGLESQWRGVCQGARWGAAVLRSCFSCSLVAPVRMAASSWWRSGSRLFRVWIFRFGCWDSGRAFLINWRTSSGLTLRPAMLAAPPWAWMWRRRFPWRVTLSVVEWVFPGMWISPGMGWSKAWATASEWTMRWSLVSAVTPGRSRFGGRWLRFRWCRRDLGSRGGWPRIRGGERRR